MWREEFIVFIDEGVFLFFFGELLFFLNICMGKEKNNYGLY